MSHTAVKPCGVGCSRQSSFPHPVSRLRTACRRIQENKERAVGGPLERPPSTRPPVLSAVLCKPKQRPAVVASGSVSEGGAADEGKQSEALKTAVAFTLFLVLGVGNRVLNKMTLVPLKNYVFFLAQFQTFGYVIIYFSLLYSRYRSGIVSDKMLSIPKMRFLAVGFCEAVGQVLMFIGAANLPGVLLPLFMQTLTVWQLILSAIFLGKRYSVLQLLGAAMVLGGSACAGMAAASASPGSSLSASPQYMLVFLVSYLFPSFAILFKEKIFEDGRKLLGGGKEIDLFVVNSFGSLAQAGFVFLLLPGLTALRNMPLSQLPDYIYQGSQCFMGITPACGSDCSGAPLLPILYVACNLAFNISALNLLRTAGGVLTTLGASAIVPFTVLAFSLPLPFLGAAPQIGGSFLSGAIFVMLGILVYNAKQLWPMITGNKLGGEA